MKRTGPGVENKLSRQEMLEKLATIKGKLWHGTDFSPHGHGCESTYATAKGIVELPGAPLSVDERVVDRDRFYEILAEMKEAEETTWEEAYESGTIEEDEFLILQDCKVARSPVPGCIGKTFFFVGRPEYGIDLELFESEEAAKGAVRETEDAWSEAASPDCTTAWEDMSDEELESACNQFFPPEKPK